MDSSFDHRLLIEPGEQQIDQLARFGDQVLLGGREIARSVHEIGRKIHARSRGNAAGVRLLEANPPISSNCRKTGPTRPKMVWTTLPGEARVIARPLISWRRDRA